MKVVAFTPSRLNSQRLPEKNIKLLGGIPLVNYALNSMAEIDLIDEIVLFASEPSICKYIQKGMKYTFLQRPASLDTQKAKVQDLIREFLNLFNADIIVMFHITSPFLTPLTIHECIEKVVKRGFDSAFTGIPFYNRCWCRNRLINSEYLEEDKTNNEPIIVEHSLYVFKKHVFEKNGSRIAENAYIKYVDAFEGHDIDTPEDFMIAELILKAGLVDTVWLHKD